MLSLNGAKLALHPVKLVGPPLVDGKVDRHIGPDGDAFCLKLDAVLLCAAPAVDRREPSPAVDYPLAGHIGFSRSMVQHRADSAGRERRSKQSRHLAIGNYLARRH